MTSSFPYRLSDLAATTAGSALIAVLGGIAVGTAVVAKPALLVLLLAVVLALLGIALALRNPAAAFLGLVLVIALIPTYAAPSIGPLLFVPGAAGAWVIAGALAWRNALRYGRLFKPNAVDFAAGTFALLMAVSVAFSARADLHEYAHLMFLWAGPYLAARLLLAEVKRPAHLVALSFALATVILAPIAVLEYLGASNPFHAVNFNSTEFAVWSNQLSRFGQTRATTSFGHPIAFSMFVATSAVLSIAMGVQSTERSHRYAWYAVAALAIGVQALALSRTGWLILAIGIVLIAAVTVRGSIRRRLATLIAIAASVAIAAWLVMPNELTILPGFHQSTEAAFIGSGRYRQALLERALQPGVLHLWGNPVNNITPFVSGSTATDNTYIILADAWGLIPVAALILVAFVMFVPITRSYSQDSGGLEILPIVAFTSMAALFFVAFITQQQLMVWLLVGAAAVACDRIAPRSERRQISAETRPAESDDSRSTGLARPA
jgi:hypothetical protein